MNVTKQEYKGRKFHKENCPQKVAAEQREYAGVPASVRIAETSDIIAEHAKLKARIAHAEEEWLLLNEELEAEMARQQAGA